MLSTIILIVYCSLYRVSVMLHIACAASSISQQDVSVMPEGDIVLSLYPKNKPPSMGVLYYMEVLV